MLLKCLWRLLIKYNSLCNIQALGTNNDGTQYTNYEAQMSGRICRKIYGAIAGFLWRICRALLSWALNFPKNLLSVYSKSTYFVCDSVSSSLCMPMYTPTWCLSIYTYLVSTVSVYNLTIYVTVSQPLFDSTFVRLLVSLLREHIRRTLDCSEQYRYNNMPYIWNQTRLLYYSLFLRDFIVVINKLWRQFCRNRMRVYYISWAHNNAFVLMNEMYTFPISH